MGISFSFEGKMENLVMKQFKDKRPDMGKPVWVWLHNRWCIASLGDSMYPLHLKPEDKVEWCMVNGEARRALPDDWWTPTGEPKTKPPGF